MTMNQQNTDPSFCGKKWKGSPSQSKPCEVFPSLQLKHCLGARSLGLLARVPLVEKHWVCLIKIAFWVVKCCCVLFFGAAWTVTSVPGVMKTFFSNVNNILLRVVVNSITGIVESIAPGGYQRIYYFVQTVKPSISMSRTCYLWKSMTTSKVNFKEVSASVV